MMACSLSAVVLGATSGRTLGDGGGGLRLRRGTNCLTLLSKGCFWPAEDASGPPGAAPAVIPSWIVTVMTYTSLAPPLQ
jgi:hypothetical protein